MPCRLIETASSTNNDQCKVESIQRLCFPVLPSNLSLARRRGSSYFGHAPNLIDSAAAILMIFSSMAFGSSRMDIWPCLRFRRSIIVSCPVSASANQAAFMTTCSCLVSKLMGTSFKGLDMSFLVSIDSASLDRLVSTVLDCGLLPLILRRMICREARGFSACAHHWSTALISSRVHLTVPSAR